MDDVRGDFLWPPNGTTAAAVIANKIKLGSFKSSEHINEKRDGPYRGFGNSYGKSFYVMLLWRFLFCSNKHQTCFVYRNRNHRARKPVSGFSVRSDTCLPVHISPLES